MLRHVRTSRYPTWTRYNNSCCVCRDRIVVSRLRCDRNNPGSNPGFAKYLILYSVMPLINLHPSRIMRLAVRKHYIAFEVRILVSGRFYT